MRSAIVLASTLLLGLGAAAIARPAEGPGAADASGRTDGAAAVDGEVRIVLRPSEAEVGDRVVATLTVAPPAEAIGPPVFPDWSESWGEAEVSDATRAEADPDGTRYRQQVTLAAFRTGQVVLPPVGVEIPTAEKVLTFRSSPQTLEIRSVLPPDVEDPDPRPPAQPRPLPLGERFWRTVAALAAACLIAAVVLARRLAAARREERVVVPPLEALESALADLRGTEDSEAFHTALSLCFRKFLGACFSFPALESTTTELRHRLAGAAAPAALVSRTERLLRRCDLVKFAHDQAAAGDSERRVEEALELGRELDRHLHPPEPEIADDRGERAA